MKILVIADEEKAVAIAGVMGGLNSEIEKDTQTVVFESAMFYGGNIRKTARQILPLPASLHSFNIFRI
jgi:phenylalanyl-tRNA synthetase beta chain